jgi:hypothetical protein
MAMFSFAASPGFAQSGGDNKPADPAKQAEARERQRKVIDEYTEAFKALSAPAGNPECVRLGRLAVRLMMNDDLDTAFRHLDLYDRFGCPGAHVQSTFRCMVKLGELDPKTPDRTENRVHACWMNPEQTTETPAAATPAAAPPAAPAAAPPPAEKR